MNKITKYLTTGTAALLMLVSIGAAQNNANAARKHYHNHTTRQVKVRRHKSWRRSIKSQKASVKQARRNKRSVKRNRKTRRNRRVAKREVNKLKRRTNKNRRTRRISRRKQTVLKPRYQIVKANRRGNQALTKSGFFDGRILTKMGYSNDFSHLIFNKYAPNDKRAKLPNYMDPKANKKMRRLPSYNNLNNDLWVKGIFNLNNPKKNTRNPQVYKYYPKVHGWELAPRY